MFTYTEEMQKARVIHFRSGKGEVRNMTVEKEMKYLTNFSSFLLMPFICICPSPTVQVVVFLFHQGSNLV